MSATIQDLQIFFNGKYQTTRINEIKKSCSPYEFQVFDFDKLVLDFSNELNIHCPPSCDCIYFCKIKKEIIFIEMRSFKDLFIKLKAGLFKDSETFLKILKERILEDRYEDKIIYSYATLLSYLGYYDQKDLFNPVLYQAQTGEKIGVRYMIHIDIDDSDYLTWFGINGSQVSKKINYEFLNRTSGFILPSKFPGTTLYFERD